MLVLSRKTEEVILIDGRIRLTVLAIRGGIVRIGIEAPDAVGIRRSEIQGPTVAKGSKVCAVES